MGKSKITIITKTKTTILTGYRTLAGQRPLERFVQRELVARILDQEHGNAAAVVVVAPRQDDTASVEQKALHTGPVRGVRPVERPGPVLAGQQRPDQLQQHGRADQEPFHAGQSAGGRRVQRELAQLVTAPGEGVLRTAFRIISKQFENVRTGDPEVLNPKGAFEYV